MSLPRRSLAVFFVSALIGVVGLLAQPSAPKAQANVVCDVATSPVGGVSAGIDAITGGAIGGGNPVGDACNAVTDEALGVVTSPVSKALKGIGNGIFDQITSWVSEGTVWLIEQVVDEIEKSTTPNLTSKGFLAQYGQMAQIATVLAAATLLLAILEAVTQGSWALLGRVVFVNVPVAFLATSVGFAIVQLLLAATDGMCHAIAAAADEHSARFFKSAIKSLSEAGGTAGATVSGGNPASEAEGAVATPVFVTFLAAIIGAFAAFFVWIELLMRDAAVYVSALFMPLAMAASIWPRWLGVLRRMCELLVVVISSKFVIVSIIALAASLAAQGEGIEPLLAASALMLLACFAPFVLFKFVPIAEGAMAAAYGRRSASGGAMSGLHMASEIHMLRNIARSNWGSSPPEVWDVRTKGGESGGGGGSGSPSSRLPGGGGGGGEGAVAAGGSPSKAAGGARSPSTAAASPATAAAAAPVAAVEGTRAGARALKQTGESVAGRSPTPQAGSAEGSGSTSVSKPAESENPHPPASSPGEQPPRPPQELPKASAPKGSK